MLRSSAAPGVGVLVANGGGGDFDMLSAVGEKAASQIVSPTKYRVVVVNGGDSPPPGPPSENDIIVKETAVIGNGKSFTNGDVNNMSDDGDCCGGGCCDGAASPSATAGNRHDGTDPKRKVKKYRMVGNSNGCCCDSTKADKVRHLCRCDEGIVKEGDPAVFLKRVVDLVFRGNLLSSCQDQISSKVVEFVHPKTMEAEVTDFKLGLKVPSEEQLLDLCSKAIKYSVRTSHPYFRNQLYGGLDPYGLAGAWISEALNTNQYTYEVAPFFMETERAVLEKIRRMVGWPDGRGDGIFCPGGSAGNMYGLVSARYRMFPQTKTDGVFGLPRLAVFISKDAHYSSRKAAHWLGLGTKSVVSVETDEYGRMIPEDLEEQIIGSKNAGTVPFCVVATSGTTVLGAFDPLDKISAVCKRHKIWLHVDACWGGSVLLSKRRRHLMAGVEEADSVIWNPHKMLGAPLQCSPFVIKHEGLLHKCNSASATYLFQQDKFYDVTYDTGDKSFQCGRKVDGFKLWTMWKARGDDGFEALVDNAFDMAEYACSQIVQRPGFKMVLPAAQCTNVCFWYIPKCLRNQPDEGSEAWWGRMEKVAPEIKRLMTMEGSLLMGYQPLHHKKLRNFFRLTVTCQPPLSRGHVDFIIDEIDRLGKDLDI